MNEAQLRNQFRGDLSKLMEDIVRFIECGIINPYSKDSAKTLHEHDTRILFFDRLLTSLGWRLGAYGNVQEEARIKADTTRFMDYVGINQETKTPLMILRRKLGTFLLFLPATLKTEPRTKISSLWQFVIY